MYFGIVLAIFIFLGVCQISWMWVVFFLIVFIKFGKYLTIIFLKYFSCPSPTLSFPSDTSITQILGHKAVPPLSNSVFKKNSHPSLGFILSNFYCYVFNFTRLFFSVTNLLLVPLSVFFMTLWFSRNLIWIFFISSLSLTFWNMDYNYNNYNYKCNLATEKKPTNYYFHYGSYFPASLLAW